MLPFVCPLFPSNAPRVTETLDARAHHYLVDYESFEDDDGRLLLEWRLGSAVEVELVDQAGCRLTSLDHADRATSLESPPPGHRLVTVLSGIDDDERRVEVSAWLSADFTAQPAVARTGAPRGRRGRGRSRTIRWVLVYGTLLSGEYAAEKCGSGRRVPARIRGSIVDKGAFPALLADARGGWVYGELVEILEKEREELLDRLDCYEGFDGYDVRGGLYRRSIARARVGECTVDAWVYVISDPGHSPVIPSGDWRARRGSNSDADPVAAALAAFRAAIEPLPECAGPRERRNWCYWGGADVVILDHVLGRKEDPDRRLDTDFQVVTPHAMAVASLFARVNAELQVLLHVNKYDLYGRLARAIAALEVETPGAGMRSTLLAGLAELERVAEDSKRWHAEFMESERAAADAWDRHVAASIAAMSPAELAFAQAFASTEPDAREAVLRAHARTFGMDPDAPLAHLAVAANLPDYIDGFDAALCDESVDGETSLHLAARMGRHESLVALRLVGGDSEAHRPQDGRTPLHIAAEAGHRECVRVLLIRGERAPLDDAGKTPADLAREAGHDDVAEFIDTWDGEL